MQQNRISKIAGLKAGDRIRLIQMVNDPDPIPAGTLGTVTEIHFHSGWTQIEVSWENGRKLMLVSPPDRFEALQIKSFFPTNSKDKSP